MQQRYGGKPPVEAGAGFLSHGMDRHAVEGWDGTEPMDIVDLDQSTAEFVLIS